MRKFLIAVISLVGVLVIFLLYNSMSKTPSDLGDMKDFDSTIADGNFAGSDVNIGRFGEVGVGTIRTARYYTYDERTKEVEREWGFETLLHQSSDMWEIEKPFMNIYESSFKCYITADKGEVKMESAVEKPIPKDAAFTGNVLIHIVPEESSDIKESHIYLDDIIFLSDKSQLSTSGPVKFISDDAQMLGTGLELVYNEQMERLEFFKITDLQFLHIRSSQVAFISGTAGPAGQPETQSTSAARDQAAVQMVAEDMQNGPQQGAPAETNEEGFYKCVFSKNVLIDTPEQLIFADRSLSISDIFLSRALIEDSNDIVTGEEETVTLSDANEPDAQTAVAKDVDKIGTEPNESDEQFVDIIITCDGGVVLMPEDYPLSQEESGRTDIESPIEISDKHLKKLDKNIGQSKFLAHTIDFSVASGDASTEGLTELTLYTDWPAEDETDQSKMPVTVTARSGAKFLQEPSQVVFEGDCFCAMPQPGLSERKDATLSAQKITVNVPKDESRNLLVSSDVIAAGPVELDFYIEESGVLADPNDPNITRTEQILVPVKVTAQKQATFIPTSNQVVFEGDCVSSMPQKGLIPPKDCTFSSPKLTISLAKEDSESSITMPDVFADGPAEFAFYIENLSATNTGKDPLPAKLTAQKQAYFSARSNKIIFEGDCRGETFQMDPNTIQEYIFMAPKLTLDLQENTNDEPAERTAGMKYLTADGGTVRLGALKSARIKPDSTIQLPSGRRGEILGGIELKCLKFEFDPNSQVFTATGPGMIKIDNSEITEPEDEVGRFSLRQPSYAFLQNFDSLTYSTESKRIIADAPENETLLIYYIPVVNGQYGDDITAAAGHVEAELYEMAEGHTGLSKLVATGGIKMVDLSNKDEFIGSKLVYDHKNAMITITGDESQPCNYNGALVDEITIDLVSGRVGVEVVTPGTL